MLPLLVALRLIATAPSTLSFEWVTPGDTASACPSAAELRARIAPLTGSASAVSERTSTGWRLTVHVNGSTRTLLASSCTEAGDAAVLLTRLGLAAPAPTAPLSPPPVVASPPPQPGSKWRTHVGALGGVRLAWLIQPLVRLGAQAALTRGPLMLSLEVATLLPARFTVSAPTSTAAITVRLPLEAQLMGCWFFTGGRFGAGPCLVGALGWFEARGENVEGARTTSLAVWSAGPGARGHVSVNSWLEVTATASARFGNRPSVFFAGLPPALEAAWVAVDVSIGVDAHF